MRFTPAAIIAALAVACSALAAEYTTTLPYEDGNTLIVSVGTNAAGATVTETVSTIFTDDDATASTTSTTSTKTTTKKTSTTTGPDTTTGQRVVGEDTTSSVTPMRTTTYWVNQPDGTWTDFTWTASVTEAPTVATANVASGSIQDYAAYQSSANSVVLAAAESSAYSGAGMRRSAPGSASAEGVWGGWVTMLLGAIGAGVGVLAL